jgi:hypothetical protein
MDDDSSEDHQPEGLISKDGEILSEEPNVVRQSLAVNVIRGIECVQNSQKIKF